MGWVGERARTPLHRDGETCSPSSMLSFTSVMRTTGAYRFVIAAQGTGEGSGVGGCAVYATSELRVSLLARFACTLFLGVCLSHMRDLSVLRHLGVPFRRCRSGQESTPIVLLFQRHNISYLCMQLQSIFFMGASERDEGTIEIHRREGEQSQEGSLFDHWENLRHPIIRAACGLGQNQIDMA